MWTMMKQLRSRIIRILENNDIKNEQEKQKPEFLLKSKKWNPYCIRHSAITADSDFLPEYALKKKVRWSMNTRIMNTREAISICMLGNAPKGSKYRI